MRIGLSSIYSFRPHVEHMYYLAKVLEKAGHELYFLTCDSALGNCYTRSLRGGSRLSECAKCMVGNIRSYPVSNVQGISSKHQVSLTNSEKEMIASSSACTLLRTETEQDTLTKEYLELRESFYTPVEVVFGSTIQWIEENKLEAIICFNGRMEVTRALTYACEKKGIPYLTQERTWFSDGLQLLANANCLSLKDTNEIVKKYQDVPLNKSQASKAAKLISSRFVKKNLSEWRAYNLNSVKTTWPIKDASGLRILILPSSFNEFQGHEEWRNGWQSSTSAFEFVLDNLKVDKKNVILRCHPNWGENIGLATGEKSEAYYTKWCEEQGIHCIGSKEKSNTFDLIQECDILLVNGSSSAFEAGACGKKVICLGHSIYENAGIALHVLEESNLDILKYFENHNPINVMKKTLRFGYTMYGRVPQFVDFVKAKTTTTYDYFDGADADRVIKMLKDGKIEAYDAVEASDAKEEDKIIDQMINKDWVSLANYEEKNLKPALVIKRRVGLQWIDSFRNKLRRGDL